MWIGTPQVVMEVIAAAGPHGGCLSPDARRSTPGLEEREMGSVRGGFGIVLLSGIILCTAAGVRAQDLQPSLMSYDFGNVPVGGSETVTFDLFSGGPTAVWVYLLGFTPTPVDPPSGEPFASPHYGIWSLGPFSFNPATYPILPWEHPAGNHMFVDVTFAPPAPGDYSTYLHVFSNDSIDPPGMYAFFPLQGTGVPATVPAPGAAALVLLGTTAVTGLRRRRAL